MPKKLNPTHIIVQSSENNAAINDGLVGKKVVIDLTSLPHHDGNRTPVILAGNHETPKSDIFTDGLLVHLPSENLSVIEDYKNRSR